MQSTTTLRLGDKVRDTITGFEGIVTSRHEYLNGCIRFSVQPDRMKDDGDIIEPKAFDVEQLVLVEAKQKAEPARRTGGPNHEPARTAVPKR